jgi:SNF2 family DNA or RNA helicase
MEQPIAVIQNQVGAYSIDSLQHSANYLFFAESPIDVISREQAERRLVRQGQKHKVFIYDLIVSGTVDQKILDYHSEGFNLFEELMRNPSKVLLGGS